MSQSATQRSLDMLELLAGHPEGLGLTEICAPLAIPKSAGHRLLGLLGERGYVSHDRDGGQYALTMKLALLGMRYFTGAGFNDLAQPILDRLAAASGELARLAIAEGDRLLWVAKAQGARYGLRYDPDTGQNVILHATSVGKAWLSTLPEEEAVRIVEAAGFGTPKRFGPRVMRTLADLRQALRETRARGYGVAVEEGEPGMAAIAVAVRASPAPDAPAVGTLSLAGPVARMTPERRDGFARELLAPAARELSALWPIRMRVRATGRQAESAPRARETGGPLIHAF